MFGLPLFERSTRGTEPTAAGASVVRFARSVLAGFDRTRDEIAAEASGAIGRTSVGAMVAATPVLLAPAIERLKARSSRTTVLIDEGDLTRLLPKLRLGELDLFVGRLEPGYASPDLETEALYDDPMVAVVHPGHALARQRKVQWAHIAAQPCVMPPPWASLRVKLEQQFCRGPAPAGRHRGIRLVPRADHLLAAARCRGVHGAQRGRALCAAGHGGGAGCACAGGFATGGPHHSARPAHDAGDGLAGGMPARCGCAGGGHAQAGLRF